MDGIINLKHWQRGLTSVEHISGTPGQVGAKMKLNYKFGKNEMHLIETITKNEFPEEFHANYDTKGLHSIQQNFFDETADGKTKWVLKNELIPTSFMMKMMISLMPRTFKKQSKKYMHDFKNFVEHGTSVANA
jgi:hypothetical protein